MNLQFDSVIGRLIRGSTVSMVSSLVVVLCVIKIINFAGNGLVIFTITFTPKARKTSADYLLLNLAIADLVFAVFLTPHQLISSWFVHPQGATGDWLCRLFTSSNLSWVALRASLFTIMVLSFERYIAVKRPQEFHKKFSSKKTKTLVVLSWVYSVATFVPNYVTGYRDASIDRCSAPSDVRKVHAYWTVAESFLSLFINIFLVVKICWCIRGSSGVKTNQILPAKQRAVDKKKKKVIRSLFLQLHQYLFCF